MSMVPEWKKCPVCHKKYSWNPDAGNLTCPYCHGLPDPKKEMLKKIFGKFTDKKQSENESEK